MLTALRRIENKQNNIEYVWNIKYIFWLKLHILIPPVGIPTCVVVPSWRGGVGFGLCRYLAQALRCARTELEAT